MGFGLALIQEQIKVFCEKLTQYSNIFFSCEMIVSHHVSLLSISCCIVSWNCVTVDPVSS